MRTSIKGDGTPSVGLLVPEVLPAPEAVDLAVSLESAGFDMAWFTENDREPFVRCTATAARTTRLRVGTGIAQWTRSPVTMALTASELHELSDGRFVCGIGTGTAYTNEGFHNIDFERPARRMSEYVKVIRGVWDAREQPFDFDGEVFRVKGYLQAYPTARPPLILAAVGDGMLRLSGRQADGVLLNPSATPWYVRTHVVPQLAAGAAQAGRSLQGFQRSVCLRASVDRDRGLARDRARHGIAEYGRYPVHQAQYALYGFGQEAELIGAAMARGDTTRAVNAVSDDMVDALGLSGTPDDVRRGLREWDGLVDSVALTIPTFGLEAEEVRAQCGAVVEAFAARNNVVG